MTSVAEVSSIDPYSYSVSENTLVNITSIPPKENLYINEEFTSSNNNQFQHTVKPANTRNLVDKTIFVKYYLDVSTANGAAPGGDLTPGAPQSNALLKACNSIAVNFNGTTNFSFPVQDFIHCNERLNVDDALLKKYRSLYPSALDGDSTITRQNESHTVQAVDAGGALVNDVFTNVPSVASPLVLNNQSKLENTTRGQYPYITGVFNGRNNSKRYEIVQPLHLGVPLFSGVGDQSALCNLESLQLTMYFNNLSNMWSADAVNNNLILSVSNVKPRILMHYIVPQDNVDIPQILYVPMSHYQSYFKNLGTKNSDDTALDTVHSEQVKLSYSPHMLYIYAMPSSSQRQINHGALFGCIDNINLSINDKSGYLASAGAEQLYAMSVHNGLSMSYYQWSQSGAPLVIDVSKDLGIMPGLLMNFSVRYTVQMRYKCWEDVDRTVALNTDYTLYTVPVFQKLVTVNVSSVQESFPQANKSKEAIETSADKGVSAVHPEHHKNDAEGKHPSGSGFLSSVSDYVKTPLNVTHQIASLANDLSGNRLDSVEAATGMASSGANLVSGLSGAGFSGGLMRTRQ